MKLRKTTYTVHRWLGIIISFQLLAWSVGGLMFSLLDIDLVHGDTRSTGSLPIVLSGESSFVSPQDAIAEALKEGVDLAGLTAVMLMDRGLGPRYELVVSTQPVAIAAIDAVTGKLVSPISEDEAKWLAGRDFIPESRIRAVSFITDQQPSEYRSKPLPVYRVDFDHPSETHVYVHAITGRVMARRNRAWRTFDFFWMLHIMDYNEREDFNHPLLSVMSLVAVLTAGTGLTLWSWRYVPRLRSKSGKQS